MTATAFMARWNKTIVLPPLLLLPMVAFGGNFATCILDKMPGISNQATHAAVWRTCSAKYPERYLNIEQGEGRGIFGFSDGDACTIEKASSTPLQISASAIGNACRCLYNKPTFDKAMCDYPPVPLGFRFDPSTAKPVK